MAEKPASSQNSDVDEEVQNVVILFSGDSGVLACRQALNSRTT